MPPPSSACEKRFGVPPEIIIAIWGLETAYGSNMGARFSIVRSLATLAYDCRRSPFFTGQLLDALRIVQRGDMTPGQLRGGWAGEIGQTQFLPTPYVKYAVDFDGDGRRDLVRCVPDIAGLHRQLPQRPRLAGGRLVGAGLGQLRRAQGLEPRRGLPAHHLGDGHQAARRARRPALVGRRAQ